MCANSRKYEKVLEENVRKKSIVLLLISLGNVLGKETKSVDCVSHVTVESHSHVHYNELGCLI